MWEPKDRGKLLLTEKEMLTHGRQSKDFWDVSGKDNGKRECGVVIKGVDRERWVTRRRSGGLLKVGTAMAAEMIGVCVLTGILDLVFHMCLCVQNINHCINTNMKKQQCAWLTI